MKSIKHFTLALAGLCMLLTVQLEAQIRTPAASPAATVTQTIGMTEVTVEYSRPGKKDREIFGGLVPYGEVWRFGANSATKITFDQDVVFGGKDIKAGSYALLAKPSKTDWSFMVYPYESGNWGSYANGDVEPVTFSVPSGAMAGDGVQNFMIGFDNLKSDGGDMFIVWDKTIVGIPIGVHTDKTVVSSIEKTMAGPSMNDYSAAASYYLAEGKDMTQALAWINKSIDMGNEKFWILRTKSLIQAKLGDKKGAVSTAKKSLELATEAGNKDYMKMNETSIKEWMMK